MGLVEDAQRAQLEIQASRRDLDTTERERSQLRRDFDQLASKLRYPGTSWLVDLEYRLVYDATIAVPDITATVGVVFETLPGALHALYVVSAYAPTNTTVAVLTDGPIIVGPAPLCTVAITRQLLASPSRIESRCLYYQNTGASLDVAVRIWRRLGMGS